MNNFTSLIAGSTGFLGSKILNALNQEDNKIYCLSRRDNNHSSSNIEQIIVATFPHRGHVKKIYENNVSLHVEEIILLLLYF